MKKYIRKKRQDVKMATFKKIEEFLKKQKKPIFKSEIIRELKVDPNSLNFVLDMLKIKKDREGKICLK